MSSIICNSQRTLQWHSKNHCLNLYPLYIMHTFTLLFVIKSYLSRNLLTSSLCSLSLLFLMSFEKLRQFHFPNSKSREIPFSSSLSYLHSYFRFSVTFKPIQDSHDRMYIFALHFISPSTPLLWVVTLKFRTWIESLLPDTITCILPSWLYHISHLTLSLSLPSNPSY